MMSAGSFSLLTHTQLYIHPVFIAIRSWLESCSPVTLLGLLPWNRTRRTGGAVLASEPSCLRTKHKSLTRKGLVICGSSSSAQLREMMLWRGAALGSEHATEHSLLKGLESFSPNAGEQWSGVTMHASVSMFLATQCKIINPWSWLASVSWAVQLKLLCLPAPWTPTRSSSSLWLINP